MAAESGESPMLRAALILVAVCVLYVLSVGPAYRFATAPHNGLPMWFRYAYFPVGWAGERWGAVSAALGWYLELWEIPE